MKLLIITQTVDKNDPILGFFHQWILEFAKHTEQIIVICLQEGEHNLPSNVSVMSLGKKSQIPNSKFKILQKIKYIIMFYRYILCEHKNYDAVFVHMNQIYVILGGGIWWLLGKKIALWYAHGSISSSLRIAEKFSDIIFTSAASGFRLKSKKMRIVGQGIDMLQFGNKKVEAKKNKWDIIKIVHIGRITKTKNIHLILEAVNKLHEDKTDFILTLVGSSITDADKEYEKTLHSYIEKFGLEQQVVFAGNVQHADIVDVYKKNDIAINLSDTGSMDKSVLEAMAAGLQVLTSNEAFADVLPLENRTTNDPTLIAQHIREIDHVLAPNLLKEYVLKHHSISALIPKILEHYE